MKIISGKVTVLVIAGSLLFLLMIGCAYPKQRRHLDIQKQIIAELKTENNRLKADCASYIANNEMLIRKVNELQGKLSTPSGLAAYGPRAVLVAEFKKAGFVVLRRNSDPAVVMSMFKTSKSSLSSKDREVLKRAGAIIAQEMPGAPLRINGYTDNRGLAKSNKKLSLARAQTAKKFLVKECGFEASRITTQGLGEVNPITSNKTRAGREKNRRIEITILTR